MAKAKYFISCVVTIPISEASAESWGSVIYKIERHKVAFKESDSSHLADVNKKFLFIKLVGPLAGAFLNTKLCKRALTLIFDDQDYVKLFMK